MFELNPYIIVDGQQYEVRRTRHLLAEYDKLTRESKNNATTQDRQTSTNIALIQEDIKKYKDKEEEYLEKFCETGAEEDKRRYLTFKKLKEEVLEKFISLSDDVEHVAKKSLDILEKIAIMGIAENHFRSGDIIDYDSAKSIWEKFVDEKGTEEATEWLLAMNEVLFTETKKEDENSFLYKFRAQKKSNN